MPIEKTFQYNLKGCGRPQILLLGNGLEYESGQRSWTQLVDDLTLPENRGVCGAENLPFPLRYELLATPQHIKSPLSRADIEKEEKRLSTAMKSLVSETNPLLDVVPTLHMDHVLTTNYSYCLERAFWADDDFQKGSVRSKYRCYLTDRREREYRLHTGYYFDDTSGKTHGTCIWHIHGECSVPRGVVLGHDRYGRLLSKIISCCEELVQRTKKLSSGALALISWPELFLVGDVYILGFGFDECEFDLWWLLRRKQRERHADGRVYFYDKPPISDEKKTRHLLLQANGVEIKTLGAPDTITYDDFYWAGMQDIQAMVSKRRAEAETDKL